MSENQAVPQEQTMTHAQAMEALRTFPPEQRTWVCEIAFTMAWELVTKLTGGQPPPPPRSARRSEPEWRWEGISPDIRYLVQTVGSLKEDLYNVKEAMGELEALGDDRHEVIALDAYHDATFALQEQVSYLEATLRGLERVSQKLAPIPEETISDKEAWRRCVAAMKEGWEKKQAGKEEGGERPSAEQEEQ